MTDQLTKIVGEIDPDTRYCVTCDKYKHISKFTPHVEGCNDCWLHTTNNRSYSIDRSYSKKDRSVNLKIRLGI